MAKKIPSHVFFLMGIFAGSGRAGIQLPEPSSSTFVLHIPTIRKKNQKTHQPRTGNAHVAFGGDNSGHWPHLGGQKMSGCFLIWKTSNIAIFCFDCVWLMCFFLHLLSGAVSFTTRSFSRLPVWRVCFFGDVQTPNGGKHPDFR